ncbi:tyrosine-protein phosphatase non-receptor type 13-like [Euwallacea fornicatus]|uniref:tyrosine-protein phosphatase non-receptor type 13-like n=1 Tax=Euwallacea fornicatus TaxID=995702 RepID=UPI00338E3A5A
MSRPLSRTESNTSLALNSPSLEDFLSVRPSGLEEIEIWAVLCQSIQALQDLFLSDGVSSRFALPVLTLSTLKLSSRGRVNFQPTDLVIGAFGSSASLANYLAPEYNVTRSYSDTEYERMWVFSLGQTLKRAAVTGHSATSRLSSELCQVLTDMTRIPEPSRASLMYLLDVMSQYCKRRQQKRPFSHIVMNLHQEALAGLEGSNDILNWGPPAMPKLVPRAKTISECSDRFSTLQRRLRLFDSTPKLTKEVSTSMEDLNFSTVNNTPGKVVRPKSICLPESLYRKQNSEFMGARGRRMRRNPVQRIASRLYGPDLTLNKTGCVGPEFVVKAALPAKQLTTHCKGNKKRVTVILLDGQKLDVTCNPNNTTAGQLLHLIIEEEQIEENFMLGLSALIAGDFVFIPADTRITKVTNSRNVDLILYLRIRFFLPSVRGLRGYQARHYLYLQLRRSVLEHQLPSSFSQIIELNGLALQAEFGDYREGAKSYFLLEHYVPETMIAIVDDENHLKGELISAHMTRKGLDRNKAEQEFITFAQNLPQYGGHFYTAVWMLKDSSKKDVWLYISAQGVSIFERGKAASHFGPRLYETFEWKAIQTLCYSKHYLSVIPHNKSKKIKKYKLKMDYKKSYFAFRLASLHHQFFLKLRSEFISLQSLSQHFGIPLKDIKNATNSLYKLDQFGEEYGEKGDDPEFKLEFNPLLNRCQNNRLQLMQRSTSDQKLIDGSISEEQQNKENERPVGALDSSFFAGLPLSCEKRRGVKMGTRAFSRTIPRVSRSMEAVNDPQEYLEQASLSSMSFACSSPSEERLRFSEGDAFVLDTTLKSVSQQNFLPNFQETINETFLEKLNNMSFAEERILSTVVVERDQTGSLGLQITEGSDGNVYIQSVIPGGPAYFSKDIMKGDQVIAVNGQSLLGRKYCDSLDLLKSTRMKVEFVLSRVVQTFTASQNIKVNRSTSLRSRLGRSPSVESQVEKHTIESCFDLSNNFKYVNRSPVKEATTSTINYHYNTLPAYSTSNLGARSSSNDRAVIVEMIPKKRWAICDSRLSKARSECNISQNVENELTFVKKKQTVALPRSLGLSRKWQGPVRYPVTPVRKGAVYNTVRGNISSDEEQVFI